MSSVSQESWTKCRGFAVSPKMAFSRSFKYNSTALTRYVSQETWMNVQRLPCMSFTWQILSKPIRLTLWALSPRSPEWMCLQAYLNECAEVSLYTLYKTTFWVSLSCWLDQLSLLRKWVKFSLESPRNGPFQDHHYCFDSRLKAPFPWELNNECGELRLPSFIEKLPF